MTVNKVREEQWRPVLGYEGMYEVSDQGRVRSLARIAIRTSPQGNRRVPPKILSQQLTAKGYPTVKLSRDATPKRAMVHVLVCEAWHGPRPAGMVARHLDDVKTNVVPANLAWGTVTDNALDAVKNKRNRNTQKTHCANGHEYTERDTSLTREGHRRCRQCALVRSHQHRGIHCMYEAFCPAISHETLNRRERRRNDYCARGHSMDDAYVTPAGDRRQCRTCAKQREQAYAQAKQDNR